MPTSSKMNALSLRTSGGVNATRTFTFPTLDWTEQTEGHDTGTTKKMHFFHLLNVGHSAEMMVLLLLTCGRTATAGNTRSLIVQYMLALRLYHAPTPIVCVRLRTFISTVNRQRCSCKAVNEMWRKKKLNSSNKYNWMEWVWLCCGTNDVFP